MLVTIIIYMVYIAGLLFLNNDLIIGYILAVKNRIRIKRHFDNIEDINSKMDRVSKSISLLLRSTMGSGGIKKVYLFYASSLGLGVLTYLCLNLFASGFIATITAITMIFIPYGILKVKLQQIRVKSSNEGEVLVTELLNNYKINYCNMKEAIEITATSIENAPNCKRLLLDVAKGFNKAATKEDFESILNVLKFSLNTSWGNVLANNIFFAQVLGIKVTESLSDLVKSISEAEKVGEFIKRENNEANLILKYLAPICFVLTVIGACKYFGFTLQKYVYYQFGTTTGLSWFIAVLLLYVAGVMINEFISKSKMDLW